MPCTLLAVIPDWRSCCSVVFAVNMYLEPTCEVLGCLAGLQNEEGKMEERSFYPALLILLVWIPTAEPLTVTEFFSSTVVLTNTERCQLPTYVSAVVNLIP